LESAVAFSGMISICCYICYKLFTVATFCGKEKSFSGRQHWFPKLQ